MKFKKVIVGLIGVLIYTLTVSQLALALREPIVVKEYIEVEVPVYHEVVEEIEEVNAVNEKEWLRNIPLSVELQEYTWELCEEYDLAYDMILAVMYQESKFNPNAINKNTNGSVDKGIAQINSNTKPYAEQLAGKKLDLFEPKDSILASVLILNDYRYKLIDSGITGQEELFERLLLSYNRGIAGAKKYIASRGTVRSDYVKKVLNYKIQLESEGGL